MATPIALTSWRSHLRAVVLAVVYVAILVGAVVADLAVWVRLIGLAVAAIGLYAVADYVLGARRWEIRDDLAHLPTIGERDRTVSANAIGSAEVVRSRFHSTLVVLTHDPAATAEYDVNALVSAADVRRWQRAARAATAVDAVAPE